MKKSKSTILALAAVLAVSLWGCGSNRDSGGDQASTPAIETAQTLGIDNCLTCHMGGVGQTWLAGVHGNSGEEPTALTDPACLACHDQLGDGQRLAAIGAGPNRPVVGCESCHGGGQYHRGVGPVPYVAPDYNRCGQCHNETFPHVSSPEGKGIVEAFAASPHIKSLNTAVFAEGSATAVRARCAKCHSDEGARLYRDIDGDYTALTAALPNSAAALEGASFVQCRTCHSPHDEDALLEGATAGRSSEFNTCTNCHQLLTGSNGKIVAYHDPAANQYGQLGEIITDTHFAAAGNFVAGTNNADIAGYAMNFADDRVCRNCHNPHNADTTIHKQWAASRHANKVKNGAWANYNWTEVPGAVRNDGTIVGGTGSRTACQRCHTTTGVKAYLTANADGNASDYVAPLAYNPNYKPEMLHCDGCHTNNVGGLRTTGRITADYTGAAFQYPDAGASNLCLACHTGRESGATIKNDTTTVFTNGKFINSHYLTAGGTVYGASGYEYGGKDYSNPSFYAHDKIGTLGAAGTGSKGPCIGCHLSSAESHRFQPVTKNAEGAVTAITSTVCSVCHTGQFALTAAGLTSEEEEFKASLDALAAQLAAVNHPFLGGYPYFAQSDWTNGGTYNGKDAMGAAFNYNLLAHDPGAYAHNRFYAKRLIFDSIDYLDNAALDGSVGTAIDALQAAGRLTVAEAAEAKTYLDGDSAAAGVQRP